MATYAGRYDEVIFRRAGNRLAPPADNTTVLVYESDGTTAATLYTDRTKATTATNPVSVDAAGNLEFFADPGDYVLAFREDGVQVATNEVTVQADPTEALFGDGASTASALSITDAGGHFTGTDVEAALQELGNAISVTPEQFGAVGDGATDDTAAIQAMFDSLRTAGVPASVRFRQGATYYIPEEVEVNADYVAVDARGATFLGSAESAGVAGGMVTVVDREDLTRTVKGVQWHGGLVRTRHADVNGLNVVAAEDCRITGAVIDLTTAGQYGMAVQSNSTLTANLRRITIDGVTTLGGEVGFELGTSGVDDRLQDLTLSKCRAIDATVQGFKVSANSSDYKVTRVHLVDCEAIDCANGVHFFYVQGGSIRGLTVTGGGTGYGIAAAYCVDCTFDDVRIFDRTSGRGIDLNHCTDLDLASIRIHGPASTAIGLIIQGTSTKTKLDDTTLDGTFEQALYNAAADTTVTDLLIRGAATGIYHAGASAGAVYDGITFDDVTTKFNATRAADVYRNIFDRSGGVAVDATGAGARSAPFGIWAALAHTNWNTVNADGQRLSTGAIDASVTFEAVVDAGTYRFDLAHQAADSRGIYTIELSDDDGATWQSLVDLGAAATTIDGYNSSIIRTFSSIAGVALTAGRWQVRLTMATKNASSSSYFGDIYGGGLARTGA